MADSLDCHRWIGRYLLGRWHSEVLMLPLNYVVTLGWKPGGTFRHSLDEKNKERRESKNTTLFDMYEIGHRPSSVTVMVDR